MDKFKQVAIDSALSAGHFILEATKSVDQLEVTEKSMNDYVSEVDRHAEKLIFTALLEAFPDHSILGEEHGEQLGAEQRYQWVIDPLDGTTNFLRSIPHYAVSIALLIDAQVVLGVIYDPAKKDLFVAQKGGGAFLNKQPIRVSDSGGINGALLATGIPFSGDNLLNISSFTATMTDLLALQTSGVRRLGAAALDLAYVAAGRYDGFWESNLKPWDIAAGILLVTEAGGIISDLKGGDTFLQTGGVLAANKLVYADILGVTKRHY